MKIYLVEEVVEADGALEDEWSSRQRPVGSSAVFQSSSTTSWHAWSSPPLNSATAVSKLPPMISDDSRRSGGGGARCRRRASRSRRHLTGEREKGVRGKEIERVDISDRWALPFFH
jgi:hypothetical protein